MFRVLFGFMMCVSIARFYLNGWIDDLYVMPKFYFTYLGFEWVKPLGEAGMYFIFALIFISSLFIMLGFLYRVSALLFFLSFTYVELIDKTNYLNHYYFISIVGFLLVFLPAHRYFSVDSKLFPSIKVTHVPRWTIDSIKLQLGIVYFFAGVAKLNYDWLFEAMPLKLWLPARAGDMPVVGFLMDEVWMAYLFSWFGCIYDLLIPFFLLSKKYRPYAYFLVIVFHVLTWSLFHIGMFPFIMIISTLIFFDTEFHQKIIDKFLSIGITKNEKRKTKVLHPSFVSKLILPLFIIHFTFQLILPFRYLLYPEKLFWTEEGFRFSWRVMLMEKGGVAIFKVGDSSFSGEIEIMNSDYLTPIQEKMMSTQPDMILQFAHHLRNDYKGKTIEVHGKKFTFNDPIVKVESYVTLNGSGTRPFINPDVNLAKLDYNLQHRDWILPYKE
jgi:hypothetical protein